MYIWLDFLKWCECQCNMCYFGDTQTALQESHQSFIGSYRNIARLVNDTRITTHELKSYAIITLQSSVTWLMK